MPRPTGPFFIVGCPRSGTTVVRSMLNAHPRLAIPPETHWIVALAPRRYDAGAPRRIPNGRPRLQLAGGRPVIEEIVGYPTFFGMKLDEARLLDETSGDAGRGADFPRLVRAVMQRYADDRGKPRWGDKTPRYVNHMPLLRRMFPDARFLHVMQDGRHVVRSIVDISGRPPIQAAAFWRRHVLRGRRDGARLGRGVYQELRLEDLVADPERELRRVCAFLGEDYAPEMLDYRRQFSGQPVASRHVQATRPLNADRPDWRAGLSALEVREVEAICGPVLAELGYDVAAVGVAPRARAWLDVAADVARRAPGVVAGADRARLDGYDAVVRD
jgi:hypothetical protein